MQLFGKRVRQLRRELRLSQEELGSRVGVHTNTVSHWERGVIPNMKKILELAKVLGTTSTYLLGETDEPSRPRVRQTDSNVVEVSDAEDKVPKTEGINSPAFIERLVKDNSMIVVENGGKFMLIPATPEGFDFVARINTSAPDIRKAK